MEVKTVLRITDSLHRDDALLCVVEARCKAGQVKVALQATVTMATSMLGKASAYNAIARAQAERSDLVAASQTVDQALKVALQIRHEGSRSSVLSDIVKTLVLLGRLKDGIRAQALIKDDWFRFYALEDLADGFLKKGDQKSAWTLLKQAQEQNDPVRVARAYARLGDVKTGLEIAKKIVGSDKHVALGAIARIQARNGSAREAFTWSDEVKPTEAKVSALIGIALGILDRFDY